MKLRALISVLAALLACGLPVAGAPAAGPHPQDGKVLYRGKTSQGRPIEVAVAPGRVTLVRFAVRALCRDGSVLHATVDGFEATALGPGGRFADVQYGSSDAVSWRGRFAPGQISGSLRVKARLRSGVGCDSRSVRFKVRGARRRRG